MKQEIVKAIKNFFDDKEQFISENICEELSTVFLVVILQDRKNIAERIEGTQLVLQSELDGIREQLSSPPVKK